MPDPLKYAEKRLAQLAISPFHPDIPADWDYETPQPCPKPPGPKTPGPKTDEGKRRSSMNSLKHALTGRTVLLPDDDQEVYARLRTQYFDALKPEGFLEQQLAQSLVDAQWRLDRIQVLEHSLLGLAAPETAQESSGHSRAFTNLSLYEHRILRAREKARLELEALQRKRAEARERALEEALMLRQFDEMEGRTHDPAADGFVFSAAELTAELALRKRRQSARLAQTCGFTLRNYRKEVNHLANLSWEPGSSLRGTV